MELFNIAEEYNRALDKVGGGHQGTPRVKGFRARLALLVAAGVAALATITGLFVRNRRKTLIEDQTGQNTNAKNNNQKEAA